MANEELTRQIVIQISERDFEILSFLSERLDMGVSDIIRSLIPRLPNEPSLKHNVSLKPFKIKKGFDRDRLNQILNEMIDKAQAKTLAQEIKAQIIMTDQERDTLTGTTEKRLIRWARPLRIDSRTRFASPKAKEICNILYGFVPERNLSENT